MQRTRAPFRADEVGSLLRPPRIKEARAKLEKGEISADDLRKAEDIEIEKVVHKQASIGLKLATDGEFRRSWWHFDFLAKLTGCELFHPDEGIQFAGIQTRHDAVRVIGKLDFPDDHPMLAHFKFLKKQCEIAHVMPKMTIPSPAVLHFRGGRNSISKQVYPDLAVFFEDLAKTYRKAVKAFYDAGCRYLQFDDTVWAYLCSQDELRKARERGDNPDGLKEIYARVIKYAIAERPADMTITTHVCRGNFRSTWISSGGYEPVAETMLAGTNYDGYFLEYDSERAGGFEPLRFLPKGNKIVVVGVITSKTGELEKKDDVKRRLEEASKFVSLDHLALSPQSDFAPTREGNILSQISEFCRQADMAESTFGRRAVNDGKLVQRLREGKRITIDTLDRIQAYIAASMPGGVPPPRGLEVPPEKRDPRGNFRFFENRQKYLLFVHTCSEKRVIAERVALELGGIHPRPPALRVFDAGVGDGTVLARVMRSMHSRFPHMPFYIAGKELSLEDVRLTLNKVPDRLFEHPATVFVLTNMYYAEAPWLTPASPAAASGMIWHEVALQGASSGEFETQIAALGPFLEQNWRANVSPKSGIPIYDRPVALGLYRGDHPFLLYSIIPRAGRTEANFDLVIASQPYPAKSSVNFRAKRIIAPLGSALRAGGRLIGIHSHGEDPGLEIIQAVWPGENPFVVSRHELLRAVKYELGSAGRDLNFNAYADNRSIFRYDMEALPNEVTGSIGTSTAFAAWNAAVYVAQIEDDRLAEMTQSGRTLHATREGLRKHNGLWFYDESYVISRRRD